MNFRSCRESSNKRPLPQDTEEHRGSPQIPGPPCLLEGFPLSRPKLCISLTRSGKRSPRCEPTTDERLRPPQRSSRPLPAEINHLRERSTPGRSWSDVLACDLLSTQFGPVTCPLRDPVCARPFALISIYNRRCHNRRSLVDRRVKPWQDPASREQLPSEGGVGRSAGESPSDR